MASRPQVPLVLRITSVSQLQVGAMLVVGGIRMFVAATLPDSTYVLILPTFWQGIWLWLKHDSLAGRLLRRLLAKP